MLARRGRRSHLAIEARAERVALRPFRPEDTASAEAWYGRAEATVYTAPDEGEGDGDVRYVILFHGQQEGIGSIDTRVGHPAVGWLTIRQIVMVPALQVHGYAAEAVVLLEEEAQRRGLTRHFLATVGPNRGLDLYFWLRLGYRPAHPDEVPWPGSPPRDIIAMVRMAEG